jgi:hypothetical protein
MGARWQTNGGSGRPWPKVFVRVPPGYWDLPEEERLAVSEEMTGRR